MTAATVRLSRAGRRFLLATTMIACALATVPASGQYVARVAMVLEISGTSRPTLHVNEEIPVGTAISLPAQTRLTLIHYSACSIVTAVGGVVSVTSSGVEVAPEHVVQTRKPAPCPRIHHLSISTLRAVGSAVVSRSLPGPRMQFSPNLDVVLTGPRTADVRGAEIIAADRKTVIDKPRIERARLTPSTKLAVGRSYTLRLSLKDGGAPLDFDFTVVDEKEPRLSLLTIE